MQIEIAMPALSSTMEEGTIASWLIEEGDSVNAGDIIAEIETDKATMEFESAENGVLARILVPAGTENVAVNTVIALIAVDGEETVEFDTPQSKFDVEMVDEPVEQSGTKPTPREVDTSKRVFASPLARRLATDAGIDLTALTGSGPKGRVVRADVQDAIDVSATKPKTAPRKVPAVSPQSADTDLYSEDRYEVVELDKMRRTIARRLTESKQTVPHFYLRRDVELDALLVLRARLNDAAPDQGEGPAYKISVNDMVIKALALALRDVPDANVSWDGGKMLRHNCVDVAVAVAIEGGLITPIVRDAQIKSISAISNEMKDLASRARARKLLPDEFQGGTTSVSNLGMFGVTSFDAVINPLQGTILAIGAGERRAVVRGEEISAATVMTVTLSVDHRVVDGAIGAELLTAFKHGVENPLTLLA